jgi:hypothetical protein
MAGLEPEDPSSVGNYLVTRTSGRRRYGPGLPQAAPRQPGRRRQGGARRVGASAGVPLPVPSRGAGGAHAQRSVHRAGDRRRLGRALPWPVTSYIAGPSLQEATDRDPLPPASVPALAAPPPHPYRTRHVPGAGRRPFPPCHQGRTGLRSGPHLRPRRSPALSATKLDAAPWARSATRAVDARSMTATGPDASTGPRCMGCTTYRADILTGTAPLDQCGKRDERDHRWLIFSSHDELPQRRHS